MRHSAAKGIGFVMVTEGKLDRLRCEKKKKTEVGKTQGFHHRFEARTLRILIVELVLLPRLFPHPLRFFQGYKKTLQSCNRGKHQGQLHQKGLQSFDKTSFRIENAA